MNALTTRLNGNMNKKVSFHLGRQEAKKEFVKKKSQVKKKENGLPMERRKIVYKTKMSKNETG